MTYNTCGYYDIVKNNNGFGIKYCKFATPKQMSFDEHFFNDWLDNPIAYGVFEANKLLGFVEGALEKWNNRYRISNICVFEEMQRNKGIGSLLMDTIVSVAVECNARMVVLETQSCNTKAIAFYKKHGFEMIGFDLYSYTNTDPQRHEVRIEMGKFLNRKQ